MGTTDFLHHLLRFSEQLRMECAFQDSTELIRWENPRRIAAPNQPEAKPSLLDNSETQPIRTPHLLRLLMRVMEYSPFRAGTVRRPFLWRSRAHWATAR